MAATIKDIQRLTGLGLATISRHLNGKNVKEKNQILIEDAIKTLNYSANEHARNLKSKNTMTVGVLVSDLNNHLTMRILTTTNEILRDNGYTLIMCNCRRSKESEEKEIGFLINKKIDGLITIPLLNSGISLKPVVDEDIPILLLDSKITNVNIPYDSITLNNIEASERATLELLEKGHRNIAIIVDTRWTYTGKNRLIGYQTALSRFNIEFNPEYVIEGKFNIKNATNVVSNFLNKHPEVTAVFASNYNATLGAMSAFNQKNLTVPDDISIIGFDNIPFNDALKPDLSLVYQPLEEMGEYAANTLIDRMQNGKHKSPIDISLKGVLYKGNSIKDIN